MAYKRLLVNVSDSQELLTWLDLYAWSCQSRMSSNTIAGVSNKTTKDVAKVNQYPSSNAQPGTTLIGESKSSSQLDRTYTCRLKVSGSLTKASRYPVIPRLVIAIAIIRTRSEEKIHRVEGTILEGCRFWVVEFIVGSQKSRVGK